MPSRNSELGKINRVHPYRWLWEPLETEASFVLRSMFGAKAAYLDGKLMLCFVLRDEPWRGLLVATDATRHALLRADFAGLIPHPILPKWLYLPDHYESFESTAQRLVQLAKHRDPRLGVIPEGKRRKRAASAPGRTVRKPRKSR